MELIMELVPYVRIARYHGRLLLSNEGTTFYDNCIVNLVKSVII